MTTLWILVANSAQAKIYSAIKAKLLTNTGELSLVKSFDHPEGRKKSGEMSSDKSGNYASAVSGHGTFVESSDPKEYENDSFARELVEALENARNAGEFHELILVAPPHFNGLLNKHLNGKVGNLVQANVNKDYTRVDANQLLTQLSDYL